MFRRRHRLHRLYRLDRLHNIVGFADDLHANGPWRRVGFGSRPRRGPSIARILLAGLAGFALATLMSASNRPNRSAIGKLALGVLLFAVWAMVLSFRRSARHATW